MKTTNQTILITGGGSGIGLALAKRLKEAGNKVIITGRNQAKLEDAAKTIMADAYYICDITNHSEVIALTEALKVSFPDLSILINNAGLVKPFPLAKSTDLVTHAKQEMETNLFGNMMLTELLIPLLNKQHESAIVNISSVAAFAPSMLLPGYSISKAALHAYSTVLRLTLAQQGKIKLFEVLPPLVDTKFSKEIKVEGKMSVEQVANEVLEALSQNRYEVHMGSGTQLYEAFRKSPDDALYAMNRIPLPQQATIS